jgi:FeS assembly SUF system protein
MKQTKKEVIKCIIDELKEVYDPELPVNIYDLGLIYKVDWDPLTQQVNVLITLTTPSCPAAELIPENIKKQLMTLPKVKNVEVEITFDPPYTMENLSEEAKLILGISI